MAAHADKAAAGRDEAPAEVVETDAEREPPEQSHHQQCKLELFHHQQAEERQPAVDINPTGENGSTTGTIATAGLYAAPLCWDDVPLPNIHPLTRGYILPDAHSSCTILGMMQMCAIGSRHIHSCSNSSSC